MGDTTNIGGDQDAAERKVQEFKDELGPFVVAADTTRMPMIFTDARSAQNDIIYANQSFLDLTGYDKADAIGLPFHCMLANEADRIHTKLHVIASKGTSTALRHRQRYPGQRCATRQLEGNRRLFGDRQGGDGNDCRQTGCRNLARPRS